MFSIFGKKERLQQRADDGGEKGGAPKGHDTALTKDVEVMPIPEVSDKNKLTPPRRPVSFDAKKEQRPASFSNGQISVTEVPSVSTHISVPEAPKAQEIIDDALPQSVEQNVDSVPPTVPASETSIIENAPEVLSTAPVEPPVKTEDNSSHDLHEQLGNIQSFDALRAYVDTQPTLEVDGITYPTPVLLERIEAFCAGSIGVEEIPNIPGLRDVALRLIAVESKEGMLQPEVVVNEAVENKPIEEAHVPESNEADPVGGVAETLPLDADEEKPFTPPTSFADLNQKKELSLPETTDPQLMIARTLEDVHAYLDAFGIVADQYSSTYMKMIIDRVMSGELSHGAIPQGVPGLREKVYEMAQRKSVNEFLATTPQSVIDTAKEMGGPETAKWVVSEEPVVVPGGASTEMEEMSIDPSVVRALKTSPVPSASDVEEADEYFRARGISVEGVTTPGTLEPSPAPNIVETDSVPKSDKDMVLEAFGITDPAEKEKWGDAREEEPFARSGDAHMEVKMTTDPVEAAEVYKAFGQNAEGVPVKENAPERTFEEIKREEVFADFATKFNISREDLEAIEGFSSLSTGQLDLVRERFTQLTAKTVEDAAKEKHDQFLLSVQEQARGAEYGFLKKMWSGFRESFLSEKRRGDFAKETVRSLREGGIAVHGDTLSILIAKMAAETAPIAQHNEETGELEVAYMQPWEGITAEGYQYLKAYNQALFDEGQRTYEKTLRSSHKEVMGDRDVEALTEALDKEDTPEALQQSEYHYARRDLMEHMRRERVPEAAILTRIAEADKEMRMEQFIRATPDALRVLEHIEEKNTWLEAVKSVAVERGVYGVAGALIGTLSAPLAAALIGGIRSWTRTKAEMREIDRAQRTGSLRTSNLAFAVSDAAGVKTPESMFGIINKVSWAVERLTRLDDEIARIEKGEKTDEAMERLSNLMEKREKVVVSLKNRVEHTEDKLRLGRINFGKTDALSQQYALMEQLTRAQASLVGVVGNSEVREKVDALISKSDASVLSARRSYMRKNVLKGVVIAGGAAGLGALIGEMFSGGKSVVEGRVGGREFSGGIREAVSPSTVTPEAVAPNGAPVADITREALQQAATIPEIVERVVKSGDTVIDIFRTEIPDITQMTSRRAQETAIANFINSLTVDELKLVGIGSGNVERIHIGETLDVGKLKELFALKMAK